MIIKAHAGLGGSLLLALFCVGPFALGASAANTPSRIVTFDAPGSILTFPVGITSAGVVVGYYEDSGKLWHGFTYDTSGSFVIIDAPGAGTGPGQGTQPKAVSDSGEICGIYIDQYGHDQGFFLDTSGRYTTLDVAGESSPPFPVGVNDNAQVVGLVDNSLFQNVGFLWTASGTTTFAPANSNYVDTARINSSGQIAGYFETRVKRRGYFRDVTGAITVFDGSPASTGTYVNALNDSGSITGFFIDSTGYHGFVRQGSSITEFDVNGSTLTEGKAINSIGIVTGFYVDASDVSHGFTRDRFGNVTLFDVPYAGMGANQGTVPYSINASGQVAGYFIGPLGTYHGFVRR
jgi:hypothetical protein